MVKLNFISAQSFILFSYDNFFPRTTRKTVAQQAALQQATNAHEKFVKLSKRRKHIYCLLLFITILYFFQAFSFQHRIKHLLIEAIARADIFGRLMMQMLTGKFFVIALCVAPMPLFYIAFDALLFTQSKTQVVWLVVYNMLIDGSANFWELNRKLFSSFGLKTFFNELLTNKFNLKNKEKTTLKQNLKLILNNLFDKAVFTSSYHYRPFVSNRLQAQMFILSFIIDKIERVLMLIYGKFSLNFLKLNINKKLLKGCFLFYEIVILTVEISSNYSLFAFTYSFIHLLLYFYINFSTFQMVLIGFHLGVFSTTLDVLCLRELNAQLNQVKFLVKKTCFSVTSVSGLGTNYHWNNWLLGPVNTFRTRHGFIVRQMFFTNDGIVSSFFAIAFAINVPFSLSMNAMLLSSGRSGIFNTSSFGRLVAVLFVSMQLLAAVGAVLIIDRLRTAIVSSAKIVYPLQTALSGSGHYLSEKLRLDDLYLGLTAPYRLKLTYTVGSLWSITKSNFAQVKFFL